MFFQAFTGRPPGFNIPTCQLIEIGFEQLDSGIVEAQIVKRLPIPSPVFEYRVLPKVIYVASDLCINEKNFY
jgi:hypothetical protein